MKFSPKQLVEEAEACGWERLLESSPITGNRRLKYPAANDVSAVVELLGGVQSAAELLGVEEIEVEHWQDDHYVPTRYVELIQLRLPRWSRWSLQTPPFDPDPLNPVAYPGMIDGTANAVLGKKSTRTPT